MNCKPGDLAVIVRTTDLCADIPIPFEALTLLRNGLIGLFVVCIELDVVVGEERWLIEPRRIDIREGTKRVGCDLVAIPDRCLRPIRDTDGQDEVLALYDLKHPIWEAA